MTMTSNELYIQVAETALQGVLEAKWGFIGEIEPKLAVEDAFRIADAFMEEVHKRKLI